MSVEQQLISIMVAAVATMMTRFIPFIIFRKTDQISPYLEKLGSFLPAAIMGVLVIYCYRNYSVKINSEFTFAVLAGFLTLALHLWKRQMPLSILGGTICYLLLVNML
jgi:branched-subunit amino acid transport protein AzlD